MSNCPSGEHGGNLDNHLHGPGATVYMPVRQPGGMLAIGDMHASMGDGEVCFTGVEIAGEVADGPYSVILDQVTNGVAVRMAVLYLLLGGAQETAA